MDGVSSSLDSIAADLRSTESASATQAKILSKAIESTEQQVLPLLQGLGEQVDVTV